MNIPSSSASPPLEGMIRQQRRNNKKRIRLILHAGTPKTGTTSLQSYMHRSRLELLRRGILYPRSNHTDAAGRLQPKHQWIVNHLLRAETEACARQIALSLRELQSDTHTVFFSTEGLFNHWWDFPEKSLGFFPKLSDHFDVKVWICFRDPCEYFMAYYKQSMINPRFPSAPDCYGHQMSPETFLKDPWFLKRLDYLGFIQHVESLLGAESVEAFPYTRELIPDTLKRLGIRGMEQEFPRENRSLGNFGMQMLLKLNSHSIPPDKKWLAVEKIREIEMLLDPEPADEIFSEDLLKKIRTDTLDGIKVIESRYGRNFHSLE
ncbi:MAG: hypothetical protein ACO3N7_00260 [Kiritimatiellia bacterium]